jgi:tripartite-type tricarboxylate transporter receptor subunit TctC
MQVRRMILGAATAAAFASMFMAGAAATDPVDFSSRRIQILVPTAAGGGSDTYARFLAPILSKHLPGNPTIIVENVPGAGAIAGSNQFQDRAKPDGTDLIVAAASVMTNFVFKDERGHYKLDTWIPVISTASGTVVYGRTDLGIKNSDDIEKLKGKELILGANNATGGDLRVLLSLDLLGFKIKPVFGMNRGEIQPSFERGEFNINFDMPQGSDMVTRGDAVPLFSLGYVNEKGEYGRDPLYPDVPSFLELYERLHGQPLRGDARAAWETIFYLNVMASRAIMLPAGTPQEIVDTYVKAMDDSMAEMKADAKLTEAAFAPDGAWGPGPHVTGAAAINNTQKALKFDDAALAWLKDWLKAKFDTEL